MRLGAICRLAPAILPFLLSCGCKVRTNDGGSSLIPPVTGGPQANDPAGVKWQGSPPALSARFNPVVTQRITAYPGLRFHPNDVITIRAGGCVDVGGDTPARRYLDPAGELSDRLYHGRVWIPGVTPGLVRIGGWANRPLRVPKDLTDSSDLFIRLGYEAENYKNVKLHAEGTSTSGQCNQAGPAFVEIQVTDNEGPAAAPRPFDLVWRKGVDANLLPRHPLWAYWAADPTPAAAPDAQDTQMCGAFPVAEDGTVSFGSTPCTTQGPWIDHPKDLHNVICHVGGVQGTLRGHVNWGVATYAGAVSWADWTFDGDYNLTLVPDGSEDLSNSILTKGNGGTEGAIELEFAAGETIVDFGTPWWSDFRDQVETASPDLYGVHAIVTGLVGMDNEHESHAELHPVFAIAMRVDPAPINETWAIFARNSGNEGFCSQDIHYMDLPGNRYVLRLPWMGGDAIPKNEMRFRSTLTGKSVKPKLSGSKDTGLLLTFELGPPENRNVIEGELKLHWPAGTPAPPPPPRFVTLSAATEKRTEKAPEGEEAFNSAFQSLTADQKAGVRKAVLDQMKALRAQHRTPSEIHEQSDQLRVQKVCGYLSQEDKARRNLTDACAAASR